MYTDNPDKNISLHFKHTKEKVFICLLRALFECIGDRNLSECVVGHEHGDKLKKCHLQIYMKFNERIETRILPSKFEYESETFLYITQRARMPKALKNYCMKENDYFQCTFNKKISEVLDSENMLHEKSIKCDKKVYNALFNEYDLNDNEILEYFKNSRWLEKRDFMLYGSKILNNYKTYIRKNNMSMDFSWKFPPHILDFLLKPKQPTPENEKKRRIYSSMYDWFQKYCITKDFMRRKALFLFSISGAKGKSYFARGLVPQIKEGESPYYVYCRGTLDGKEFEVKKNTARIIIIDDVGYIGKDLEIWKALAVGEPTNIRTPYYNDMWEKNLPCIILSNDISTLNFWLNDPSLNTRCVFITIDFYIGPPGTYNSDHIKIDSIITDDVIEKLNNIKK